MSSTSAAPQESWARRPQEVASVIAVCIVFLILSYYSILKRLFCIATSPRNQGRRRLLNDSIADDPSLQFQSHGLEVSIIHSLPMSQFKKSEAEEKPINTDCAICLGEFEEGEWLKHLPNCNHVFHVSCIDTWFQSHSNCPLCRSHAHRHPSVNLECSLSTFTILETSRRGDFIQERAANFQSIRSATLHNSGITHQSSND